MSDTTERARLRSTLVDALNGRPNIDRDQAWDILAEWDKVAALAAELAAAEKRNAELNEMVLAIIRAEQRGDELAYERAVLALTESAAASEGKP